MVLFNLIGRRRHHGVIYAVSKSAEPLRVNVLLLQFKLLYKLFHKILIETNVNINYELNFSDVYGSVNYIGSLAKFT